MVTDVPPALRRLTGTVVAGRYAVEAVLGIGGMAIVFRGRHVRFGKKLAIKFLRPEIANDADILARFDREARAAASLDHANCIRVLDSGAHDGHKFMIMPLLEGAELSQVLLELPVMLAPSQVVAMAIQLLRGLEHAHARGLVHRDIKPDNVFVTRDAQGREVLKLVDFGIAKIVGGALADGLTTKVGVVVGTPAYMSPEQATGGEVDARADLYALGVLLYQLLQGTPPFAAPDAHGLLYQHVTVAPPPLREGVPERVGRLVLRLLAKKPSDRFPDATAAAAAFEQVANELRTDPTPWVRLVGARDAMGLEAMDDALERILSQEAEHAEDNLLDEIFPRDDD
jgi:serine/threonine protein kinase